MGPLWWTEKWVRVGRGLLRRGRIPQSWNVRFKFRWLIRTRVSLRRVQLTEDGTGERERVRHVVGVDESGNPTESGRPHVFTAVHCSRERSERLAELLVDCGLNPWQNKSSSLSAVLTDPTEQSRRVEEFVAKLASEPMTWRAAFGWQRYSIEERAAVACTVASKAITSASTPSGRAVLLHDGGEDTYGSSQIALRKQAAAKFNYSFQSAYCPVFVTSLAKADLTYPEVIAADYLAGYVRSVVEESGSATGELPPQVGRIHADWREPETSPLSRYRLRASTATHRSTRRSRVAAWIEGRRPADHGLQSSGRYDAVVSRLASGELQSYLREIE